MGRTVSKKQVGRLRRKSRVRKNIHGTATRPRLSVFRSARHIHVQVIDDDTGTTLAAASSLKLATAGVKKTALAEQVGATVAKACLQKQIEAVVFDRSDKRYHGRVQAVAEAARASGLRF